MLAHALASTVTPHYFIFLPIQQILTLSTTAQQPHQLVGSLYQLTAPSVQGLAHTARYHPSWKPWLTGKTPRRSAAAYMQAAVRYRPQHRTQEQPLTLTLHLHLTPPVLPTCIMISSRPCRQYCCYKCMRQSHAALPFAEASSTDVHNMCKLNSKYSRRQRCSTGCAELAAQRRS